jgi:hypothetical protein
VKQPWYADHAGAGGNFQSIWYFFQRLQEIGPDFEYFPEPTKSILIVHEHNLEKARSVKADLKFKVKTGNRYLGGFIGEEDALRSWLEEKTTLWTDFTPLLFLQTASLARKPKHYSSISQLSSWRNGRNLTLRYVAMSMLKSALPLFEPLTSVCRDLIFQQAT